MPGHVMLSYQWDDQALVKRICSRLKEDGLRVWMDVEGGVTGNIHDSMAAGVEEAVAICPFMTPAYQASRSCKKELSYADAREVTVVPVMLADDWEASEWLGLMTAGLLWADFRNAEKDQEHFEMCVRSLEEELLFNAGPLLLVEPPATFLKKPGRRFCHALSRLSVHESEEQLSYPTGDGRHAVELSDAPGALCYWEEIKGSGCKYYRNVVTSRYLGFDPVGRRVHAAAGPSACEEWLLLVDRTDQSHQRAVVIKNRQSGSFLAVQNGHFVGLTSYNEDCKWLLE